MAGVDEVFGGLAAGEAEGCAVAVEANEEKAELSWDVAVPLSVEAASMTAGEGGGWEAEREGDTADGWGGGEQTWGQRRGETGPH